MHKLAPLYVCQDCGMEFARPDVTPFHERRCPYCGSNLLEEWYTCPGCGKEKLECDFTLDDFDLCRDCFEKEVKAMEKEAKNPARRRIIAFLKECS